MQDDGIGLEGLRRAVTALDELKTAAALLRADRDHLGQLTIT
jgi:hypothetical protein